MPPPSQRPPGSESEPTQPAAQTLQQAHINRVNRAEAVFQQGMQAHQAGDLNAAISAYQQCLALNPQHPRALNNLAVGLRKRGQPDLADACYRRALQKDPNNPSTLVNHGNALRDLGQFDAAEAQYKAALELDQANHGAWYGLGLLYRDMKRLPESIAALERALADNPNDAEVQWDLSHSLLCAGDFRRGMSFYEARWGLKGVDKPSFPKPEWDGQQDIAGQTLLLYGEQGFGDVVQFVRFIPMLTERGATILLHCRPELIPLLHGQFSNAVQLMARDQTPDPNSYQWVAPLLSVPRLLGLNSTDIPTAPYIRPPRGRVHLPLASQTAQLKVGLCWQGSPTHKNDRNRSMPFIALAPLLRFSTVALFSLQKGPAARDPVDRGVAGLITVLDPHLKTFAETAAIIAQLDLVITVDTSVLHVAAAMGKEVWMLLPISHDWRVDAHDSLHTWYPTVRTFKQTHHGDWASVICAVCAALEHRLSEQKADTPAKK